MPTRYNWAHLHAQFRLLNLTAEEEQDSFYYSGVAPVCDAGVGIQTSPWKSATVLGIFTMKGRSLLLQAAGGKVLTIVGANEPKGGSD